MSDTTTSTPASDAKPLPKKRSWRWRFFRFVVLSFAALVTLFVLFHAVENWRGKRAWEQYRKEQEAKGGKHRTWIMGGKIDLKGWQKDIFSSTNMQHRAEPGDPAEDVLYALKQYDDELAELLTASATRPLARFDIKYAEEDKAGILLPHLAFIKGIIQTLRLRAVADLSADKPEQAFQDVSLMFRLIDSIESEPILISKLVRFACIQIAVGTIWEGLADHRWQDAQLEQLQAKLATYDFVKDGTIGFQGERLFGNSIIEYLYKQPHMLGMISDLGGAGKNPNLNIGKAPYYLIPSGWFQLEQLSYNKAFQEFILVPAPQDKHHLDITKLKAAKVEMERQTANKDAFYLIRNHRVLIQLLLPAIGNVFQKSAYAQSTCDLAVVAIALERYYLKNKSYPSSLGALVPDYATILPLDIAGQSPFKYERQSADSFRLWSIGWNQKDDEGKSEKQGKGRSESIKIEEGDWTWPQVEKAPKPKEGGFE
ncbi:MAG: hypothetical protein K0Q55_1269 [Verrucomicrobia bacterium]|nr:hypothetical protein [Verrucomicrobiota bacterium]